MKPNTKEDFWDRVDKSGDCWLWTGTKHTDGYGRFSFRGRKFLAHRFSYELEHGTVPQDLNICHSCDNPPCLNPAHLWAGTQRENVADRDRKGRCRAGTNPNPYRTVECPQGHSKAEHGRIYKNTWHCRECDRARRKPGRSYLPAEEE